MACDQSYFRRPNKKQGHTPEPPYNLRFLAPGKRQASPHSKQRSLINLGPFRADRHGWRKCWKCAWQDAQVPRAHGYT